MTRCWWRLITADQCNSPFHLAHTRSERSLLLFEWSPRTPVLPTSAYSSSTTCFSGNHAYWRSPVEQQLRNLPDRAQRTLNSPKCVANFHQRDRARSVPSSLTLQAAGRMNRKRTSGAKRSGPGERGPILGALLAGMDVSSPAWIVPPALSSPVA